MRAGIERRLDELLKRGAPDPLLTDARLRAEIAASVAPEQVYVVLATAVAEVGRDHDYDWAIVEPSSMRSIIQLAGRVRRHRPGAWCETNLVLLERNVRALKGERTVFCRPGFESDQSRLNSNSLRALLEPEQLEPLTSAPRILPREHPRPTANLVDMEHAVLEKTMERAGEWWRTPVHLTAMMQRWRPFRANDCPHRRMALMPDEDGGKTLVEQYKEGTEKRFPKHLHPFDLRPISDASISFWGVPDYLAELERLAEELDMDQAECARRFGYADLPARGEAEHGWFYHDALGFWLPQDGA